MHALPVVMTTDVVYSQITSKEDGVGSEADNNFSSITDEVSVSDDSDSDYEIGRTDYIEGMEPVGHTCDHIDIQPADYNKHHLRCVRRDNDG